MERSSAAQSFRPKPSRRPERRSRRAEVAGTDVYHVGAALRRDGGFCKPGKTEQIVLEPVASAANLVRSQPPRGTDE